MAEGISRENYNFERSDREIGSDFRPSRAPNKGSYNKERERDGIHILLAGSKDRQVRTSSRSQGRGNKGSHMRSRRIEKGYSNPRNNNEGYYNHDYRASGGSDNQGRGNYHNNKYHNNFRPRDGFEGNQTTQNRSSTPYRDERGRSFSPSQARARNFPNVLEIPAHQARKSPREVRALFKSIRIFAATQNIRYKIKSI